MSSEQWHADIEVTEVLAKTCIEEQFKQLAPLQEIMCIGEGWDNKVFLVNHSIVFRFPRRRVAVQLIERENAVLSSLQSQFSIEIPDPQYIGKPSKYYPYPFHGYPIIKGRSGCHASLTSEERIASIKPLALFLKKLHQITEEQAVEMGAAPQVVDRTDKNRLISALTERVNKINKQKIFQINKKCFEEEMHAAEYNKVDFTKKTLVHGDLYCRHLMFNQGKLSGIIDWGDTGINHCSIDLAVLYSFYPKSCHDTFFSIYGSVESESLIHSRFLGLYSALTVLLYAHDTNDQLLLEEAKKSLLRINPNIIENTN